MTIRFAKLSLLTICGLLALQHSPAFSQQAWNQQPSRLFPPGQMGPWTAANSTVVGTGAPSAPVPPTSMQNIDLQDVEMYDIKKQHAQLQQAMTQQAMTQNTQKQQALMQHVESRQAMMRQPQSVTPQSVTRAWPSGSSRQMPVVTHTPAPGSAQPYVSQPLLPYQPVAGVGTAMKAAVSRFKQAFQPTTQSLFPQANPYVTQSQVQSQVVSDLPAMGTPPSMKSMADDPVMNLMREASVFEKQGNVEKMAEKYRRALEINPNNRHVQLSLARVKHRMGEMESAKSIYNKMLARYPNDAVALNDLGLLLARQGDIPGSMKSLRRAVALQPRSQRYRNNLATVLIEADELNEALSQLQDVHGEAVGEFNMGYLLAQRGQVQLAGEHLRVALHLDPSLTPAQDLLAKIDSPVKHIAIRPTTDDRATSPIILRRSAEIDAEVQPAVDPASFHAPVGADSGVAPLPSAYEIPGIEK